MSGLSSFPGRSGGEYDEPLLDMVFDRRPLPPGAPPEMHDLARFLAAAAGAAEPGELAGEASALAVFGQAASPAGVWSAGRGGGSAGRRRRRRRSQSRWPARRRRSPSWHPAPGWARLAVALVTAAIVLGSTAAYIGVLPSRVQQMAHVTLGAPAPAPAQVPDRPGAPLAKAARPPLVKRPALRPAREPRPEPARSAAATRRAGRVKAVSPPRDHLRSGAASGSCTPSPPSSPLASVWKPGASALATPQATQCSSAPATATPVAAARAPSRSARRESRR